MKKIISLVLILCVVISLSACSIASIDQKRLEGSWVSQTKIISGIVTETTFTFNEDETGNISTLLGINVSMTYSLEDGKITIVTDTPVFQKTLVYAYEISSDELILTDNSGDVITFARVD